MNQPESPEGDSHDQAILEVARQLGRIADAIALLALEIPAGKDTGLTGDRRDAAEAAFARVRADETS